MAARAWRHRSRSYRGPRQWTDDNGATGLYPLWPTVHRQPDDVAERNRDRLHDRLRARRAKLNPTR